MLIALAIIVLPMLLGGRPEGSATGTHTIEVPAEPPELDFETRRYPIGERSVPEPQNTPEPANKSLPEPSPAPASPPTLETRPAEQSGTAQAGGEPPRQPLPAVEIEPSNPPAVEPEPARTDNAAGQGGRWVVQVASFCATGNANRLSKTLRGYGYDVVTDTIRSDVGTLHRVRVGPYPTEAAAAEAVKRVSSQVEGVKPRIMDLQPEKAANMTEPADPLVRWVVQVGSFASAANAER
ncbi:MAG: SPOR domain-containing protein, partial [Gammaproteobacteria bacterium]